MTIVSPENRSVVQLPLTLRWNARLDTLDGGAKRFGIFVDRATISPGRSLRYLARDDQICRRRQGCPDDGWLAQNYVFRTTETTLTIERLPDLRPPTRPKAPDLHEAAIILLDDRDRRVGESAFRVSFIVDRG